MHPQYKQQCKCFSVTLDRTTKEPISLQIKIHQITMLTALLMSKHQDFSMLHCKLEKQHCSKRRCSSPACWHWHRYVKSTYEEQKCTSTLSSNQFAFVDNAKGKYMILRYSQGNNSVFLSYSIM